MFQNVKIHKILNSNSSDESKIILDQNGVLYRDVPSSVVELAGSLESWLLYDSICENRIILKPSSFHLGPSCWSSAQVEDYLLFVEEICTELARHGFTLIDGHPWNFVFEDSNIKFIDFGSFIPFTKVALDASLNEAREFKYLVKFYRASYMKRLRMYLAKNATSKTRHNSDIILETGFNGLHDNDCYLSLPERFNRFTNETYQPKSTWSDYRCEDDDLETKISKDSRFQTVNSLLKSSGANKVIDVGSNDGLYSIVAAGAYGISALALEIEDYNSSKLYYLAKENRLKITSATCTLEDYVYHLKFIQKPFRPVINLAILLAVFHHMVHDANYTVQKLVDELEFLGVKKIILEFISYEDIFLCRKVRVNWYSLENIIAIFKELKYNCQVFPEHDQGRRLMYIEKRICDIV